jgi:hypothetical protein
MVLAPDDPIGAAGAAAARARNARNAPGADEAAPGQRERLPGPLVAPSNYGTTLDGITELASLLDASSAINGTLGEVCDACVQQEQGSAFLANTVPAQTPPAAAGHACIEDHGRKARYARANLPSRKKLPRSFSTNCYVS